MSRKQVNIRLPEGEIKVLKDLAKQYKVSQSTIIQLSLDLMVRVSDPLMVEALTKMLQAKLQQEADDDDE